MTISYNIQLSNGRGYNLVGCKELKSLLDKFAAITQLGKGKLNNVPSVICRISDDWLPGRGWQSHNFLTTKIWHNRMLPDTIYEFIPREEEDTDNLVNMRRILYAIYRYVLMQKGLPMHSALVEFMGKGVILAGGGGAGKTTCCERLPSPWRALCDDELLITCNKLGRYFAHPMPTWSDYLWRRSKKTWDTQAHLDPAMVCLLRQAKKDKIVSLGQKVAAASVYQSAIEVFGQYWSGIGPREATRLKARIFKNACNFAKNIPVYALDFSLSGRFWKLLEEVIDGR